MKKAIRIAAVIAVLAAAVFGYVIWSAQTAASKAVEACNAAAEEYNDRIAPYNEAADGIEAANEQLQGVLDTAQARADKGAPAYDPKTLEKLQKAIEKEKKTLAEVPARIEPMEMRAMQSSFSKKELDAQREEAEAALAETEKAIEEIPGVPDIPDYSAGIESVQAAQKKYEDSVQKLANVTAPPDSFVRERLLGVKHVEAAEAVTAEKDPNGLFGKKGGYVGCVYFLDERVDRGLLPEEAFRREDSGEKDQEEGDFEGEEESGQEAGTAGTADANEVTDTSTAADTNEAAAARETVSADIGETADAQSETGLSGTTAAESAADIAATSGTAAAAEEEDRKETRETIDVVMIGTIGGGAVEIYSTEEEAKARKDYLDFFAGSVMDAGASEVEKTCVIRTSKYLDSDQQEKMMERIRQALLAVEGE